MFDRIPPSNTAKTLYNRLGDLTAAYILMLTNREKTQLEGLKRSLEEEAIRLQTSSYGGGEYLHSMY
jgi:hypothetical protein